MVRWITKDDPSWGETLAKHRRYQEYERRKTDPIRKDRPMTTQDYISIVKNAPNKAAQIFSEYRSKAQAVRDNHLIPETGKFIEIGNLRQQAHDEVQALAEQTAVATDLARKALAHHRDAARPKVDADTWSRKARHFQYLVDRGVNPDTLVKEISDPIGLRIAQEELPLLERGQTNPQDPTAGEGVAALLEHKAYEVYGMHTSQKPTNF